MANGDYRYGQIVWRELLCPDTAKAKAFYGELCGWSFSDMPMGPGMTYVVAKRGDKQVGGFMPAGPNMGPPAWLSYVSVKDIDAVVAAAKAAGGKVPMEPVAAPGVGRFCPIGDPTGGFLGLLQGESAGPADEGGAPAPGEFCWETLNTTDIEQAKAFYTAVVGWSVVAATANMNVFAAGERQVADVEAAQPGMPSHWLSHLVVGELEAARTKAERLGAKVLVPVIDIPGIGRICLIADPLGAVVSLYEPAPRG